MINIAICDDNPAESKYLSTLVNKWAVMRKAAANIINFQSAEGFLFSYDDNKAVDILLLDIQMGGMDGVTLAKTIRAQNKEVVIIFVTGYMEYIADGYDVEALHYLMKPVSDEKLEAILDRAVVKLAKNERALYITHAGEGVRIPLYEIRYLEVLRNYVTVHANGEYLVKKTLSELEKGLDESFFRIGRSHIVNLRYVRKCVKDGLHLADGVVLPLPRGAHAALNRAMIEYL